MRGISEERLRKLIENDDYYDSGIEKSVIYGLIANECQELNPWMTLEEFLKSGFEGECWIFTDYEVMERAYYDTRGFRGSRTTNIGWPNSCITDVQPIHKPEPPQDEY